MFSIFSKKKLSAFPSSVEIKQLSPVDDEIAEEWHRICESHLIDIHGVYAAKWKEGEYRWELTFAAGEFIREEPFVQKLNEAVFSAISSVDGVKEAHAEDTEKYIIAGEIEGRDLINSVSLAIDEFAKTYVEEWKTRVGK